MRVLLTTTSFQDTPGKHHDILAQGGYEIVRDRGPLNDKKMLDLITSGGGFDALLCGDDDITARVIDAALPRLKVIAKYGIGVDKIDMDHATRKKIPVLNTPGVNHTTVAEHTVGLMIAVAKGFWFHTSAVKSGQWKRQTGYELAGKTLGILGVGRIGKEVAKRCAAMEMNLLGFDFFWDVDFASKHKITRVESIEETMERSDVVTLHMNLSEEVRGCVNKRSLSKMKDHSILVNTGRGGLVVEEDIAEACKSGKLLGYGADVLEHEPIKPPHPFQKIDNIILTPHIASRTYESVERQGIRAALNLVNFLKGDKDFIQANKF
jgi:D-3-phosphoglycerate dehydrogenase / 2-oxoglutarate reductase